MIGGWPGMLMMRCNSRTLLCRSPSRPIVNLIFLCCDMTSICGCFYNFLCLYSLIKGLQWRPLTLLPTVLTSQFIFSYFLPSFLFLLLVLKNCVQLCRNMQDSAGQRRYNAGTGRQERHVLFTAIQWFDPLGCQVIIGYLPIFDVRTLNPVTFLRDVAAIRGWDSFNFILYFMSWQGLVLDNLTVQSGVFNSKRKRQELVLNRRPGKYWS